MPAKTRKIRLKIEPEAGGELEQLLIANKLAHDQKVIADADESESKERIKAWLLSLFPPNADGTKHPNLPDAFDIAGDPHGRYPGYTMSFKSGTHLNTDAMPDDLVATIETYRVPNKPSWDFREATQGGRR